MAANHDQVCFFTQLGAVAETLHQAGNVLDLVHARHGE